MFNMKYHKYKFINCMRFKKGMAPLYHLCDFPFEIFFKSHAQKFRTWLLLGTQKQIISDDLDPNLVPAKTEVKSLIIKMRSC